MSDQINDHILLSIKRSRLILIILGVAITAMTSLMVYRITSTLDGSAATKIDLAGKQRTLSQRILTDALIIDQTIHTNEWDTIESTYRELQTSIAQLQQTHETLSLGNKKLGIQGMKTPEQIDAFVSIEPQMRKMSSASKELGMLTKSMIRRAPYIDAQTAIRVEAAKNEILSTHTILLPQFESVVKLYESEYKSDILSRIRSAKVGIAMLIGVLVTIMLFVIEPTFLIIRKQISQLKVAIDQANRADAVRWRLLTNIGHEFRTPMTAIMGFADLLNEGDLSETERSGLVKSIFESSTELTSLIETMLDMSAIEAGQLRIGKKRCDVHELLTKSCAKYKERAMDKSLDVTLTIDESCPQFVETDPKRFKQVVNKIIDNSVKFTEAGCVNIHAQIVELNSKDILEIKVADTGIGIEQNHIEAIFNPFQQAEDALTREYGGAGLGLSISRDIAKALGGNVAAASTPGAGSTFTITIDPGDLVAIQIDPDAAKAPVIKKDDAPKPMEARKLLIVDDAKDNRMLLKHILKKTGAEIEFAMDGKQALEAVDAAIKSELPFDLILMDMQMPVMDGYFATVKLREQGINTPVIAVTAHALEGDRQHCLDSGCDEYLTKPINKKLLIETCVRLIDESKNPEIATDKAA